MNQIILKNKGLKSTKTSKVFPYYYLISIDILEPFNSVEQRAEGSKRIEGHTKTFYEVARSVFYVLTKNSSLLKGNNTLKLSQNNNGQKMFKLHRFLNPFSMLPAVKRIQKTV